ncbi:DNA polymerase Y family protein [Leucobacter luti]|uniref:Protein ImuB n=1 Tax=Leucobacter luti TaxID=340320 RepID=A0A4Q7TWF0_9MICO|nr:DNA polymerase Y family protein [Leucobacter luti]MBL3698259.1 DNA polymerase Y family protein [Leucobacter luti]RZT64657.1 protein ImuB [Leucobacter luti]
MSSGERALVFWVPDWPVHAYVHDQDDDTDPLPPPIALVANRRVVACSAAAREAGVRVGLREREAQMRCPDLAVRPHDPEIDERRFAPVLAAIERLIPGIESRRPGLCAMRARGPARYYGGEEPAAAALLALATELDLTGVRIGIADGIFAAEQAARAAATAPGLAVPCAGIRIVPAGASAAFLSPLPVDHAAPGDFAEVLSGLGIRTLGALAALPEDAVRQRFGAAGVAAHRRATATGPVHGAEVRPRAPVREFSVDLSFEPPIDTAEQLAFACATLADRFISGLAEERLVCTALRIELTDDISVRHEREWAHPHRFTASDTVGRVRWQAASISHDAERGGAGITRVRITPTHTDRAAAHEPGLWNTEPDERVHHHLSRAQNRLGHAAVGTAQLSGGRLLASRQTMIPWGTSRTRPADTRGSASAPWPGALTGPVPSRVFATPLSAALLDVEGVAVSVDAEDLLTALPARLRVSHTEFSDRVEGWSAPWPVRERWWQGAPERFRLQLRLADGDAWLLYYERGEWFAEGRYD